MQNWLAIGPVGNWEIGLREKVWAVSPAQSKSWEKIAAGDRVFFYATAPVKGIIGYGIVSGTEVDEAPFWPQERAKGEIMWPFRIRFSGIHALKATNWEQKSIRPGRAGIVFQRAFQPVAGERAEAWRKHLEEAGISA